MYLKDSLDFSPILSLKLFLPSHLFLFFVFVSLVWSLPSVCVQLCNGVSVRIGEGFTLSIYLSCVCHSVFLFPYFDWFQFFVFSDSLYNIPIFFLLLKIPEEFVNRFLKISFFYSKRNVKNPTHQQKEENKQILCVDDFRLFWHFFFLWLILFPSFHQSISDSICSWSCVFIYTWCVCKKN